MNMTCFFATIQFVTYGFMAYLRFTKWINDQKEEYEETVNAFGLTEVSD